MTRLAPSGLSDKRPSLGADSPGKREAFPKDHLCYTKEGQVAPEVRPGSELSLTIGLTGPTPSGRGQRGAAPSAVKASPWDSTISIVTEGTINRALVFQATLEWGPLMSEPL